MANQDNITTPCGPGRQETTSTIRHSCGSPSHFSRRTLLQASGLSGLAWLTAVAHQLARAADKGRQKRAKSVIVVWLAGGPSQLETFDPHPGANIAGGSKAIATAVPGIQLADGLPQTAEVMPSISLVRSVVSQEGDHERATYNIKTGFRPDPTIVHPSIGAVLCHQLPNATAEIPRHVSIFPNQWPARGGYLGDRYDAFKTDSTEGPLPDMSARVSVQRYDERIRDLHLVEQAFAAGRLRQLEPQRTLHIATMQRAREMMSSDQIRAFRVDDRPRHLVQQFGDSKFGRSCLVAIQLIEVGVRCVEVTLDGWDSHINNHESHRALTEILDPGLAGLVRELGKRDLLDDTIVLCGGEFGRTPTINPAGGRDHWPHGFSVVLAGGGIRGGHVVGTTDPEGGKTVDQPVKVEDIHATVLDALGIDFERQLDTPVGRPMKISQGRVIRELRT